MRWPKLGRVSRLLISIAAVAFAFVLLLEYRLVTRPHRLRARIDAIRDERIALGPSHPWAGRYSSGGGLGGHELELAPRAGFVDTTWGDVGPWSIDRSGSVSEEKGVLVLRHRPFGLFETERYVPLRWGARHYLVREGELPEFANAINNGWEPGYGSHRWFLIRAGDEEAPVRGLDGLPDEVRRLILDKPINAHVVSVGEMKTSTFPLTGMEPLIDGEGAIMLDVGSRDGARLDLILNGDFDSCWRARVTRVEESRSEAMCKGRMQRLPRIGDDFKAESGRDALKREPLSIRLSGVPSGVSAVKDAGRTWGWNPAAARKAGFSVREMGRISADIQEIGQLGSSLTRTRIDAMAAEAGANVIVEERVSRGSDMKFRAALYRLELNGIPLKAVEVPAPSRRPPDYKKEFPVDWRRVREKLELEWRIDSEVYSQRANEIFQRHREELFRVGPMGYERWLQTDCQDLTSAQREALRKYGGVDDGWGTVSEAMSRNFRQDRSHEAVQVAADTELKALQAAEPASFARYNELRERWHKLFVEAR